MKKLRLFSIVSIMMIICGLSSFAQELSINSTKIAGELGNYISLSDNPITYTTTGPNSNGETRATFTVTFIIKKHNPNIGYFELKANVLSFTNSILFSFDADYTDRPEYKVNHNPYTGEKIANAIKGNVKTVTVQFNKVLDSTETNNLLNEGSTVSFHMSRIK